MSELPLNMTRTTKIILGVVTAVIVTFLLWRFANIIAYFFTALVFSFVGRPLVRFFRSLRVGRLQPSNSVSSFLALLVIVAVIAAYIGIFVPLIVQQANLLTKINLDMLNTTIDPPVQKVEDFLKSYHLINEKETVKEVLVNQLKNVLNFASFSDSVTSLIGLTGALILAVFSILFLTFFFLKDAYIIDELVDSLTPPKYYTEVKHILSQSKHLLTRYFIGLTLDIILMMAMLSLGLTLFGIQNALLIGFLGGLLHMIPYLGIIIGSIIGVLLAISASLSMGYYSEIMPLILMVVGVFSIAYLIDNVVFQPLIFSASVKAHPVEIFLVVLIAGSITGIIGMILAIPAYTVLRIIAKEFFSQFRIIQNLTRNI